MKVRAVTSLRHFDALAPLWRELTEKSGQTCPLLSHDWYACSWRSAGPECRRELFIVEDSAGPAAFIPLAFSRGRIGGLPVRRLTLLVPPDAPFADVPIAGPVDQVLSTLFTELQGRRDWDVMSLVRLPARSTTFKALEGVLRDRFTWRFARREHAPYVTIAGRWNDFERGLSASARVVCQAIEEQLQRRGEVSLEEHRQVDPDGRTFIEAMEVFWAAWTGLRSHGFGIAQSLPRFFRELTRRASENGWLHLWILRVDGRAVATEYQLGSNGTLHALRRDHDASVRGVSLVDGFSLGMVRALFHQREAIEYDLGPAWTSPDWATGAHGSNGLDIFAPTAYGRVLHRLETRLLPAARRWRGRASEPCA